MRVAQDQFSFTPGDRLTVSTTCGLAYIKDTSEKFSVIMLDVDSKDISSGMSCPPPSFLESQFLDTLSSRLAPGGMLVLNLVCRDSVLRASLMEDLSRVWSSIISYKLDEEVNEIIFCSTNEKLKTGEVKKTFSQAFKLVNDHVKKATRVKEDLIDLEESMQLLKVSH